MLKKRLISGTAIVLFLPCLFLLDKFWLNIVLIVVALLATREVWIVSITKHKTKFDFLLFFILPVIYIFSSFVFVAEKLRWECNIYWLISAIIGSSTYDISAYFFGKSIGRHKIIPKISPNKTWEGTIGGFLGPILVAVLMGKYFLNLSYFEMAIFALLVGILAFFGDLSVSWYKRALNVKDMGCIIPGHGGLLDRIDSHLLVLPGVYFFQLMI